MARAAYACLKPAPDGRASLCTLQAASCGCCEQPAFRFRPVEDAAANKLAHRERLTVQRRVTPSWPGTGNFVAGTLQRRLGVAARAQIIA
jgi:hypothetical protein